MLISVSMALLLLGSARSQYGNRLGDSLQASRASNVPHSPATATRSNLGFQLLPRAPVEMEFMGKRTVIEASRARKEWSVVFGSPAI
jgi:hypothetical protein